MLEDAELLNRFARENSEDAFAQLVQRQVNFVYAAALRRVGGDSHLAEDVTQQVFTALARDAASLTNHPVLSGWLYTTTRNVAAQIVRGERRRQAREQEALIMNELTSASARDAEWERLRPVLDDAMDELSEGDRQAVLLRFFEGKSFADLGAKLWLNENAARMRVERALDKLHALLARRGVTSTASALGAAMANQAAATTAPAGLAASITGVALTGASVTANAGVVAALLAFMTTGKIILGLAGVAAAIALGTAFTTGERVRREEVRLSDATKRQVSAESRLAALEKRVQVETQRVVSAEADNARLQRAVTEQQTATAAAVVAEQPVTSDIVQARMNQARELVRNGDYPKALSEMTWLFDTGMKQVPSMGAVRRSFGVSLFAELAGKYPPARAALDERREAAREKMLADAEDFDAMSDYGAITRELKDGAGAIALLEQFPPGDRRRAGIARAAFDDLIDSRRYALALEGRNAGSMLSLFEATSRDRPTAKAQPEATQRLLREGTVRRVARDIEVLAGAGDLTNARTLAARLLAYDNSESTQAILQQHLVRAEQPNLLSSPNPELP